MRDWSGLDYTVVTALIFRLSVFVDTFVFLFALTEGREAETWILHRSQRVRAAIAAQSDSNSDAEE